MCAALGIVQRRARRSSSACSANRGPTLIEAIDQSEGRAAALWKRRCQADITVRAAIDLSTTIRDLAARRRADVW